MAQGKVTVNNQNQSQGGFPGVERIALFIGEGNLSATGTLAVNSTTDLDSIFINGESELTINVRAAQLNGGENWQAYVSGQDPVYVIDDAIDASMGTCSPELIVICTPTTRESTFQDMADKAESLRTTLGRRVIFLAAYSAIDSTPTTGQTWADYLAVAVITTGNLLGSRLAIVPQLHGNNVGVLAGRLCNRAASIADSPMRVATGPVLGLGAPVTDMAGWQLDDATLTALDALRLSCPQRYPDYPGIFWGDCNLFDAPGGDYQVIENLRPVDKAARAIRLLAIAQVANRSLNGSPASIASNKTYFARPLREMSHSTIFAGQHYPGDIQPPKDDAVQINWVSITEVEVWLKVQPYNSPKTITANIVLDLSGA